MKKYIPILILLTPFVAFAGGNKNSCTTPPPKYTPPPVHITVPPPHITPPVITQTITPTVVVTTPIATPVTTTVVTSSHRQGSHRHYVVISPNPELQKQLLTLYQQLLYLLRIKLYQMPHSSGGGKG